MKSCFDNVLLDEQSYENILIYDVLYKSFIGTNPLCIIFNKVFGPQNFGTIFDRIRYFIYKY